MATTTNPIEMTQAANQFLVVHPLDDIPERKVDTDGLGPMPMTRSVCISLLSLRAYLVVMMLLVAYHVLVLASH